MLIAKCLNGKYEAKLETQGGEGNKPNNNPWWKELHFVTTISIFIIALSSNWNWLPQNIVFVSE